MRKTKEKPGLISAENESCFWINNGPVLKNLKDLKVSLLTMSKETFSYHANKEKNDFAAWTKEVLKDKVLATKLAKTKTLKSTIKAIESSLKKYK